MHSRRPGARTVGLVAAGLLAFAASTARAEPAMLDRPPPFEKRWVMGLWMGAPAGVGYSIGRSVGDRWRVKAAVGTPMLLTGAGGAIDVVRGVRLGSLTLWLGMTVAGYASDNCSWGGCGEYVAFWGAGPQVGFETSTGFVAGTRLVADLGVGVAVAFDRTDNLARCQPLGGLRLGVGW